MSFQIDVTSAMMGPPPEAPNPTPAPMKETLDLLRQMLEIQKEQLAYQRALVAFHDMGSRWRAYLTRWHHEFPGLSEACRRAMPQLERSYGQMITDLTDRVSDDGIDNEFALQEFLDRYGMRLAQLGTILNLVAPLAESGPQNENA